jgi:rhamnulokinase
MMSEHCHIACDLGAESGRVILGRLRDGKLTLEEVHRFPNNAVKVRGSLRWNIIRIYEELLAGLRKAAESKAAAESLSVDSWGVDYVLFSEQEPLLSLPYQYRDARTDTTFAEATANDGAGLIFAETGIQLMQINTLYQLMAEAKNNGALLKTGARFLNIADYLNFLFSGIARAERSLASTTQIYNPVSETWSQKLIRRFDLPESIFPQIVPSGARLGPLRMDLQEQTGLADLEVIASCSHDTAAAVAAIPAEGDDWAFLSSGTWSLMGVELPAPLINAETQRGNFTNEAGHHGTTRFLKNIIGLWILQESRRAWEREGTKFDYAELNRLADEAEPFRSLINPNAARFLKPDQMPGKISDYCRETGQPVPETPGQFTRCILESLALLYRQTIEQLEQLTGRSISRLHIVGGGSQSVLLNQFVADATGRVVLAGPVEATAIGNVLIQALTLGHLESPAELRKVVRNSFPIREFAPRRNSGSEQAFDRFAQLTLTT